MARTYRTTPDIASASRRVAALGQHHDPDDPRLGQARAELQFVKALARAREIAEAQPPLTPEQLADIAAIIHPGAVASDAT